MHEIVIIQRMVKPNQKDIMKITNKGFQKKHKIDAEILQKKKEIKRECGRSTYENMSEEDKKKVKRI